MEGDGEGLVAIVQGLDNSGVTLTVCNRPRLNADRSRPPGHRIQINSMNQRSDLPAVDQRPNTLPAVAAPPALSPAPAVQRNSVETSTGTDFSRMATASQICDGRYASSYKLAHCMVSPTSPPEAVTEFPPQRKEPCRNQGNFEIGGQSSAQWGGHGIGHNVSSHGTVPPRVSTSRVRHYGGTQTWADKGSSHRYTKSNHRETEAFAHSLRKYPSMAPFRTASTDLIEKLIRYTQAKNYQDLSRSTKSMRSLRHQKSPDTYDTVRPSKHQQTYTRRQDDHVSSHVQVGHRGRTRNFKLYSPMNDSRHLRENRYRDTTTSGSYDYLKAGNSPHGRSNRSDSSPSPQRRRSPEESPSPDRSRSPNRSRSPEGSRVIRAERSSRADRPHRFERSVRDLSLSEMSRYIRSTIRQICNERPVVVQVCPKLKDRFNQHRKVCPNKNERSDDVMEFEEEEEDPEDQASGSVLSRFLQSLSGRLPLTEQTGCQCTRADCYCSRGTQCVNNSDVTTSTACSCTTANKSCCPGMPCLCAMKAQDRAYYNKRIDKEISEWLKDVPVTSIEDFASKNKRENIVKELRRTLKQLPDDEHFEENAANEIQGFVDDFPLWNPGKDENDEKLFKNQLADKLTEKITAIPRKPNRFRDIVKKWVANLDFEDDGEEVDKDTITDNFVNRLKSLAADRPACDVKYTHILRKEIIELLVELAVKSNGDMKMLKKTANNLAKEIVSIPRNVNLSGDTDLTSEFEDKIADWICEHGLCNELKKDPKLIEGLAKKLNKLKSQGIYDDDVIELMKEEVQRFVDDVGLAFETIDELIEELMKQLTSSIQLKEKERLDQEELLEAVGNWLRSLPGDDLHPRRLERMTKDLVKMIQDSNEEDNDNLANDIVNYLADTELSIDPAEIGIYVEELMEKLNILPSNKFYKEQAKRMMLKDINDIIEVSPMSEEKKTKMRSKAKKIVELNLRKSSLNLGRHDSVNLKESLLRDMDDAVSDMGLSKESQLQLKSLLSTSINKKYDKSFTGLNREQSDLKQTITKDVKNAIKELPIDTDKQKDLIQQVRGSLSKNINKPLPSDIKDNIKDDISDVIEKCPICEDRNILGRIKKVLSEVASKHLAIYLPPCVCDIQNEVEEDVSNVIERSSLDMDKKRELKENIQDILTENKDRPVSDEVIKTIQDDISSIVSDLSIPQDEKDDIKKAVHDTVSKDFHEAGRAIRHDLNKIRNKLLDDITNVIEKSPIQRDVKSHLKGKLDSVLAKNLDSSLSNEEKHMILDEVSNIVGNDMPEDKRMSLENKLAKKLDIQQREQAKKGLIETIDRLSIDSSVKDDMKKEIDVILLETLYYPLTNEVEKKIEEDVMNAIDELDIPDDAKKKLMSDISHAIGNELDKLNDQNKEVPEIKMNLEKVIENEIKKSPISKNEQEELQNRTKGVLTKNLDRPVTDELKETIKERLGDIVDDLITDKGKADAIKTKLLTVANKDFTKLAQPSRESFGDQKRTMALKKAENEAVGNIVLEMERAVDEAPVPRGKKSELKKKLKNIAVKNFEKPLEDVTGGLREDINEIFDELNLPIEKKNKLKNELIAAIERNMDNLLENTNDINAQYPGMNYEEVDVTKVKDNTMKEIEKKIDESAIPKGKKPAVIKKLKTLAAESLEKPFSQDVQDTIRTSIYDIIDEQPITKSAKIKLKNELTSLVDKNVDDLRGKTHSQASHSKEIEEKPLYNTFQEMDRAIEDASIPSGKKKELKKKLKNLEQDFKKMPSENVAEALEDDMIEIIDELNLTKEKKNKLKGALNTAVAEYQKNLQNAKEDKASEYVGKKRKPSEDTYRKSVDSLKSIEEFDARKVKDSILILIDKNIEQSAIPEDKKVELKRKLKKVACENLKKPFPQDVHDNINTAIADIINDLKITKAEKMKLKSDLTSIVDESLNNLRGQPRDQLSHSKKLEEKPLQNTFQEIERAIEEASIPRGQKKELKKKLENLATQDFKTIPSENVAEVLEGDMIEIIDELNLPKEKKNKLKSAALTAVAEYQKNLQSVKEDKTSGYAGKTRRSSQDTYKKSGEGLKPTEEVDATKVKDSILKGIDKHIDQLAIPEEKKIELKRKLKKVVAEHLKKPFSQDVQDTVKTGIAHVIDDLSIPKSEKNKLKNSLINMVDEDVDNLRGAPHKKVAGLRELRDDVIENELNLSKGKKNKFKSASVTAIDQYKKNLQAAREDQDPDYSAKKQKPREDRNKKTIDGLIPIEEVDATMVKNNILKDIEKKIEEATIIPEGKKTDLKRKLKTLASENLKKPFSEDVQDTLKTKIADIIDSLPISKSDKNKLKGELTSIVDENVKNLRSKPHDQVSHMKKSEDKPLQNIFQEMDHAIDVAPISKEKKIELKEKLKNLAAKDFKKIPSEEVTEALEGEMIEIIDELNLPKDKKNKLKSTLLNAESEYVSNFQAATKEKDRMKVKDNIFQGIEKAIAESAVPESKKSELKRKLKTVAAENLKKSLSKDNIKTAAVIADIIHGLPIPTSEKNKLKNELTSIVNENMDTLRSEPRGRIDHSEELEDKPLHNIFQVMQKAIKEASIPKEKKKKLKNMLRDLAAKDYDNKSLDEVAEALKDGMFEIIDNLNLPKDKNNKLKSNLKNMIGENLDILQAEPSEPPSEGVYFEELEDETQRNILQGFEKVVNEAPIPKDTRSGLNRKLRNVASKNFEEPLSDEVANALKNDTSLIIDKLNLSKDKPEPSEPPSEGVYFAELEDETQRNILQGFEKVVNEAPIPKDTRSGLNRKLKNVASKNFEEPLSDEVANALKNDTSLIIDKLNVSKDKHNTLKNALSAVVDENMSNYKNESKLASSPRYQYISPEKRKKMSFPKHVIDESNLKESIKEEVKKSVLKSKIADPKKSKLQLQLLRMISGMLAEFDEEIDEWLKYIYIKYGIKPDYQKILAEEFDKLLDIALKGGDLEEARRRLIAKLMRDLNLSEKAASALVDEMIKKAPEVALKQGNSIQEIIQEEVTRASKLQIVPEQENEITKYKEAFTKAINNAVEQSTLSKSNKSTLKNNLLKKLTQTIDNSSNKDDIDALKAEVLQKSNKIVDESSIPAGQKKEMKAILKKEIAKAFGDAFMDDEESSDDEVSEKIKEGSTLHKSPTLEYKQTFTKAISNAVEKSTVSKPNKSTLQNKLLKKLKETIDGSSNKNNVKALKAKVLQESNKIVDESSIPASQKKEMKALLKKEIAKAFGDEIIDDEQSSDDDDSKGSALHESPTPKYKEAFTKAISNAVEKSTVSKPNKSTLQNKLLKKLKETIDGSSNKNNVKALKAKVLQESNKIVDESSIPASQKKEMKALLKKEIAKAFGDEIIDDEQSSDDDDSKGSALHESPTPKYKEAFTKAISNAVEKSTVSKPNKSTLQNKLLKKLKETTDGSPNKNDIKALKAEVVQESKKIVDESSIPAGQKKEMKSLLKKEIAKAFGDDILDDGENSDDDGSEESVLLESPTPEEYREKIIECIKTWMDSLPMDFDPEIVADVAEDLASDIIDRQKYFRAHPEAISANNDEIENLKYQVFRRLNNIVDPKDMPLVMDRTEELYRMIMGIESPEGVPKLGQTSSREQSSSEKRRKDQANRKQSASATLSTGNINYSLKELIATNKNVRKQWSRHLDNALSKLPQLRSHTKDLKDKLAIYDETGQIDILSALSTNKEDTNNAESSKSSKNVAPKPALKINKGKTSARLSKIEETFPSTSKQKSPFTPNSNGSAAVSDFTKKVKDTINNWLKTARVDIDQNEKNRILEELANDIVYKHKYVQTFGVTPSRNENLEYLKLQIHRRFNGLVPIEVLKKIIENTKDLVPQIEKLKVPKLVQAPQIVEVVQRSPSPTQRKLGPADILGIRSKATNTTRADGVPHTVDDDDGVEVESDPEFSPGQASTPSKSAAEQKEAAEADYFDKVIEAVTNWIESMPIELDPDVQSDVINDLTSDIVDRQKYLQMHPDKKFSDDEEIENLRFQVFKRLDKVVDRDTSVTPSPAKIEELYKMIAGDGRKKSLTAKQAQEFQTALNDEISAILNNYHICCDKRELLPKLAHELTKLRKTGADQDEIVENLIATIQPLTYLSDEDAEELAYKLLYRTKKLIATIRGDAPVKKKDLKEATMKDGAAYETEGCANEIPLEESNATMDETGPESKSRYGMSFNGLSNFIDGWLSSIHTDDDDTKDEEELMDEKRARMYCLVHKIGEMNVDPEIFNDNALYEAVLREELQHLLGDIKMDEEEFQALKEELVKKVLEAQRRAHDEIAGQNYKKKLRDTMSKLLPDQKNLSKDDQATIETLKDQLADAYIDLHYSGNDENQRDRLKRKIANEINTFCKDYLNRNPCSPLNSKTLNNDLYTALNKVPLPPGDSIRYEVEQARIREEINDWVKELPLQPQSPTELLARNKLIYVLSKKLFDIEVEEQEEDEDNELMRKHIVSFLNKLPLESEAANDAIADTLINKLKASEESRKYDSSSNVTVDAFGNVTAASTGSHVKPSVCPGYKLVFDKPKPCTPSKVCPRHPPRRFDSLPPCTLSPEDKAHLEKIRRRTCVTPSCVTSLIKKHKCDSGSGPPPVDAGSQTILGMDEPHQNRTCPFANAKAPPKPCPRVPPCAQGKSVSSETEKPQSSPICPAAFEKAPRICPAAPSKCTQGAHQMRRYTISSSNISDGNEEAQPNENKQYYWDPCEKNSVDDSEQQQSGRSSRRQSDPPPCHPGPPCHTPRPAPCRPAPCGSPKPPCAPPRPAPCSPPRPTCRPAPCGTPRPPPCRPPPCPPPRPATCRPPGPCDPNPTCFSQPFPPCRRPNSAKLKQQSSPQSKSPRQNSSERYSYFDNLNSFTKSSQRDIPICRSPYAPSPCMSSFGQYTPPGSPGFSKRFNNECRMPKRDGLQDQVPSTSSRPSQKERVIELGSLDDVNARPKKRPSDTTDWPKFHEDDHFWAAPMRRVILDEGIDESVVMERERKEERVTCRCKERLVPKSGRTQPANSPSFSTSNEDGQNMKRCSKCCGIHCPYPSFLYFRQ